MPPIILDLLWTRPQSQVEEDVFEMGGVIVVVVIGGEVVVVVVDAIKCSL